MQTQVAKASIELPVSKQYTNKLLCGEFYQMFNASSFVL